MQYILYLFIESFIIRKKSAESIDPALHNSFSDRIEHTTYLYPIDNGIQSAAH